MTINDTPTERLNHSNQHLIMWMACVATIEDYVPQNAPLVIDYIELETA